MVRTEALNALSRMDPENFSALMRTILSRKDECSAPLRRSAVFLIGEKRDAGMASLLVSVAKSDPNIEVRGSAIDWLARVPGDEGLATLSELARSSSEDERIQRAAVRALAVHPSDQARQLISDVPDQPFLYEKLTGREFLQFVADLYGMPRDRAATRMQVVIDLFSLHEFVDDLTERRSPSIR